MGRPRKKDRHLPACVYQKHGAYYHVKSKKWTKLADSLPEAMAAYGRLYGQAKGSMPALIERVLKRLEGRLAANTLDAYRVAGRKLQGILAEFSPEQVLPRHIAQIKASMADSPATANRCLTVLRVVFDHALEEQLVDRNPVIGIRRHAERSRERLISRDEFDAVRAQAGPRLQVIMDLLFLTGQRVGDVLKIRRSDLLDQGIAFAQQKTGTRLIVGWSADLREAVERAKSLQETPAVYLVRGKQGNAENYSTVLDQWNCACQAAGVADAHLHDIRAMAATAMGKAGASALLGHANEKTTQVYLRGREIPVVEGPSFRRLIDGEKKAQ